MLLSNFKLLSITILLIKNVDVGVIDETTIAGEEIEMTEATTKATIPFNDPGPLDPANTYLMLVFTWGPSGCLELNEAWDRLSRENNPCGNNANKWVIHGVWAEAIGSAKQKKIKQQIRNDDVVRETEYGNEIENFEGELEENLNNEWFTLNMTSDNKKLWLHEFSAHGLAVKNLGIVENATEYFELGLLLEKKYSKIETLLNLANIKPGTSILRNHLAEALAKDEKKKYITCKGPPQEEKKYVYEVSICFDIKVGKAPNDTDPNVHQVNNDRYLNLADCDKAKKENKCDDNIEFKKFDEETITDRENTCDSAPSVINENP